MLTGPTGKDKAQNKFKSIQSAFSSLQERHIMGQCESKASTANEIQVDTARLGRGEKAPWERAICSPRRERAKREGLECRSCF